MSRPDSSEPSHRLTRRAFLALSAGVVALLPLDGPLAALGRGRAATAGLPEHPEPRPGIDGSRVLGAEELSDAREMIPLFDAIREIPHIVDGIRCHCGCADLEGYRSLLSCYEAPGMALYCDICEGEGRLAHRRWQEGQTLDQIRRAIDARFGPGAHHSAAAESR